MRYFLFLCFCLNVGFASSQRLMMPLNKNWQFTKVSVQPGQTPHEQAAWQNVTIPHTWNTTDVMDDEPGYYRGLGWYKTTIGIDKATREKNLFLYFEGANQVTELFVNGKSAGTHIGGYTAFCFDISRFIHKTQSANEILIKVDNSHNENIIPLSADFTFYGGLYRNVSLIATGSVHFSLTNHASNAVFITTPSVSAKNAVIKIDGSFTNSSSLKKQVLVKTSIQNNRKRKVKEVRSVVAIGAGENKIFHQSINDFNKPQLWSPEDPYLYTVLTELIDVATGTLLDSVKNPLGLRWFDFDAGKGFSLNGKSYKIIGTSRHQDFPGKGNAVTKKMAREDLVMVKEAGFNFFRVAHYPQDPEVLQACDELGLLASVEIPLVNEITESEIFNENCRNMQVEMIRQSFNHPSVIIWCSMNEIFLKSRYGDDPTKQRQYFSSVEKLARSLDSISRKEDPYRYTMIVNHADYNKYNQYNLTNIAMITGWNLYPGWYSKNPDDFPAFLDRHHQQLPRQPFMVTEYGADADPRIRSLSPLRFDKSVEYATAFHQFYITEIMKRPFVSGGIVWNLADFSSETRNETMPHVNNKGLMTGKRIPKDPYYLYQAHFSKSPFVKIASSAWTNRAGAADSLQHYCTQPLQVATNLQSLSLNLNGKTLGTSITKNGLAEWLVPFQNGLNVVEVWGLKNEKKYQDRLSIQFVVVPEKLEAWPAENVQLNILLGAKRYFIDEDLQQMWIPDQDYRSGSWGSVGGKPFTIQNNFNLPYGTDKNILDTDKDPVYQTQQAGIQQYRFDVPAGHYELTLHFAELLGGKVKLPPYNLADSARDEQLQKRVFNVSINGVQFLNNFDITSQYGRSRAIAKKTFVAVPDDKGITINFSAIQGEAVLNAVQLNAVPPPVNVSSH